MIGASSLAVCCVKQNCFAFSAKTLFGAIVANIDSTQTKALAVQNVGEIGV